jgi:hypothetical protein
MMTTTQPTNHPTGPPPQYAPAVATVRERRRTAGLDTKLAETMAALFALSVAVGLWYTGAVFTLLALDAIGIPASPLGIWRWLIPIGISAIELRWWPRGIAESKVLSFAAVALIDGASTLYGLVLWGAGRMLPLATGIHIPSSGPWLVVPALLAALILTFVPERLALRMLREVRTIWSA